MSDASAACPKASGGQDAHSAGGEQHGRPEHGSSSSVFSNDEFHDCCASPSTASESLEGVDGGRRSSTSPPRPRSRTDAPGSVALSSLRRSSTVKDHSSSKREDSGSANRLVEARARRAIRAMAEACTTGVSVREADEKRGRTFGRILAERGADGGPGDWQSVRAVPMQIPLHHASSHTNVADLAATGAAPGSKAPGPAAGRPARVAGAQPDMRARSLTDDANAAAIARSASLETRIGAGTRAGLARWLMCFGTVDFDVDQGPTLRLLYPHAPFSTSERAAICFSSMPDSPIYDLYDCVYTFNVRVDPARLGLPKDRIFLHGHVFFRQKRDPLMRRGGLQRSVVIISHLPYHGLFARVAHILGPLYFDLGTSILEAAARDVASWPAPVPGGACELAFLGSTLSVELPVHNASQLLETSRFPLDRFDPGEHILAGVSCDGLLHSFRDALGDLWTCWELMLLGEPLVVLADSPYRCSEAIVGLLDIIFPIMYCGHYRPYFTIQDPDFRAVVSKTHVPHNTVVGVSNPFFSEALGHWPHKLFLGTSARMSQMQGGAARRAPGDGDGSRAGGLGSAAAKPAGSSAAAGTGANSSSSGSGSWQGLQSKHRCAVSRDRPFVGQLLSALRTGRQTPWMANNTLRRYFIDLTVQFLAPLDRYFSTLIPVVRSSTVVEQGRARGSVAGAAAAAAEASLGWLALPGALRPWRTGDFLASLESLGISPQLGGHMQAASAANVSAPAFSGRSSGAGAAGVGSSASGRAQGGGTGTALPRSSASPGPAATPWKNMRGARGVGDEWRQLYSQFLKCGNFATWLAHRTSETQRVLLARFRREVCQGDMHAWCRGFDHPLGLGPQQLAAEIELLDLTTMDLGRGQGAGGAQPHVRHVFYHGGAEDERARAERRRQQMLQDQRARLTESSRPVYGSDGSLVGYTHRTPAREPARHPATPPDNGGGGGGARSACKRLGQRITHARRAPPAVLQAAWGVVGLLGAGALEQVAPDSRERGAAAAASAAAFGTSPSPPSDAERRSLLEQLSILVEYMPAEAGRVFQPLVADDYRRD